METYSCSIRGCRQPAAYFCQCQSPVLLVCACHQDRHLAESTEHHLYDLYRELTIEERLYVLQIRESFIYCTQSALVKAVRSCRSLLSKEEAKTLEEALVFMQTAESSLAQIVRGLDKQTAAPIVQAIQSGAPGVIQEIYSESSLKLKLLEDLLCHGQARINNSHKVITEPRQHWLTRQTKRFERYLLEATTRAIQSKLLNEALREMPYCEQERQRAQKLFGQATRWEVKGNYKRSAEIFLECARIQRKLGFKRELAKTLQRLGGAFEANTNNLAALTACLERVAVKKNLETVQNAADFKGVFCNPLFLHCSVDLAQLAERLAEFDYHWSSSRLYGLILESIINQQQFSKQQKHDCIQFLTRLAFIVLENKGLDAGHTHCLEDLPQSLRGILKIQLRQDCSEFDFQFTHPSIVDYLAAKGLINELAETPLGTLDSMAILNRFTFNFRVRTYCWILEMVTELALEEKLVDIVLQTKSRSDIKTAAGNALTLLNFSGYSFVGKNFNKIKAHSANLSGAVLRKTKLNGAELQSIKLYGCKLLHAAMKRTNIPAPGLQSVPFVGHPDEVTSVCISPSGELIASGRTDWKIFISEAATGQHISQLLGHTNRVSTVVFTPDSTKVVSGSWDMTVRVWECASRVQLCVLQGHTCWVSSVCCSFDGELIVSGSNDKKVIIWNSITSQVFDTLEKHSNWVTSVACSSDGALIASGSGDGRVIIWGSLTRQIMRVIYDHSQWITSICFTPDSARIASGNRRGEVTLWQCATGRRLHTFDSHSLAVTGVCCSPDGMFLASSSQDKTVILWSISNFQQLWRLDSHFKEVLDFSFSPDSACIVSGSSDKKMILWDVLTGRAIYTA